MKRPRLSHSGKAGPRMVDVGGKPVTRRTARAEAWVAVGPAIAAELARRGGLAKGDVLATARLAGIMAAKKTAELIPLCHGLALDVVEVRAELTDRAVRIVVQAACHGRTGAEMEALTGAAVAALTVYDMVKSAGRGIEIGPIRLLAKAGGRSGRWRRKGGTHGQG